MKIFKSIAIAFSLYSKLPMPSFDWKEEDMKYCMCAFPFLGVIQAMLAVCIYQVLRYYEFGVMLTAGIMTLLPILFTGGIHMDGLLDTYDALCSYGDKEKKLAILKDPHIGGFAVIHAIVYVLITFVCWNELIERVVNEGADERILYIVPAGYVLSRILSALSVIKFKKAKDDGMVSDMSRSQDKRCFIILILELILFLVFAVILFDVYPVILLASLPVFAYYRYKAYREFGGINGDLAGWFLQLCELMTLICAMVMTVFLL